LWGRFLHVRKRVADHLIAAVEEDNNVIKKFKKGYAEVQIYDELVIPEVQIYDELVKVGEEEAPQPATVEPNR
jgi:hypothetical protein